ncbi:4-(cytidine 5'-diphospho)-2-C-methyl-D-erythritol kinase [soil metagenome]
MVVFPNAKINLGLNILEKRTDGYHNLSTAFYPISWCDVLEIIPSKKISFSSSGLEIPGKTEDNLIFKAYHLLRKDFNLPPVAVHLHKAIPVGAGLGGGSSDASFTLKALNDHFNIYLDSGILELYAAQIGSDCPFFIENKPVLASGTGNIFEPLTLDLKGKYIVVVFPNLPISTAEAFAQVTPKPSTINLKDILENKTIKEWKDFLRNDFEEGIFKNHPVLADIKKTLYDQEALYSSMSGSGAALFGIFDKEVDLKKKFSEEYIVWQGRL